MVQLLQLFLIESVRLQNASLTSPGDASAMPETNPCLKCGACCACYKVAFDLTETDACTDGIVPSAYTVQISQTRCAMRGTQRGNRRCIALEGVVGQQVTCTIYSRRPSCCHHFLASWEKDIVNPICNRARIMYGMQPFDAF